MRLQVAIVTLALILLHSFPAPLAVQSHDTVALSGVVRSQDEGNMEGVVVTARRDGAILSVSVVSDPTGTYHFPHTHLEPGSYRLTIRAVGYDLVDPGAVTVSADATSTADLELRETTNLGMQLSSGEWAMSMPGTPQQKSKVVHQLVSCAYCHTFQRIMRSRHTAERFLLVIQRMGTYYPDGAALSNDSRRGRAVKKSQAHS